MPGQITKGSPQWENLNKRWLAEQRPGYVVIGDDTYRAIAINDEEAVFVVIGGLSELYSSSSFSDNQKRGKNDRRPKQ